MDSRVDFNEVNEEVEKTLELAFPWSSCCFRIVGGWISHEVYFHSKGRPASSRVNGLSVLLAFLRQLFTDQSGNAQKKKPTRENTPRKVGSRSTQRRT